jgi:hypothetical protein
MAGNQNGASNRRAHCRAATENSMANSRPAVISLDQNRTTYRIPTEFSGFLHPITRGGTFREET